MLLMFQNLSAMLVPLSPAITFFSSRIPIRPSVDEQIVESVSATKEALEPTPTPDIASTAQARLTRGR